MPIPIDIERWPRREAFHHFVGYRLPWFSVCTKLDVAPLARRLAAGGGGRLTLAYHFIALKLANAVEPLRLRLHDGGVWLHERIDASTTVLRADGSFAFARLVLHDRFADFAEAGAAAIDAAREGRVPFDPLPGEPALLYCTTLPWLHFSSFSHARNPGQDDSIPRLAFGRIDADAQGRRWLPVSIDVHHALVDGVHVGDWVQRFEAALAAPEDWV